ncbi:MAG: amino acid adenylation domain-containing protein [Longimicrobiales bacterium]
MHRVRMLYLLTHAVDRAADRAPGHPAIRFNGQTLLYGDLSARSNQLAHALIDHGVRRGDRVGIFMPKRLEGAIAIHGTMKAGAAYVPIDPAAPPSRIAFILRDCEIRHVVTEFGRLSALGQATADGVALEAVFGVDSTDGCAVSAISWDDVATAPATLPPTATMEQDLAYILYTSGSTGVPKGVMHTHRSALSFAEIAVRAYGLYAGDRLSNHAPLHFDLSTLDYFAGAVAGATTVVIPESHTKLPASLSKLMQDERLTVLYAVPFALVQLLLHGALDKRELPDLRWVLFGGEPFPPKHLRALMTALPQARFVNIYGPTEVNGVTHYPIPPLTADDSAIPIGQPYGNVEMMIADENDQPVAPGEAGLLLIRSPTMMRGYWRRPDLNARAFFRRPAFDLYEDVFHRTGDLVQEGPDGNLDFLGRKDRQIKVRGYRVELDEIEAALLQHEAVEAAAAFPVPEPDGSQHIEAAAVLRAGGEAEAGELMRYAASHLPPYAVPERVAILREFPRTSTDKIDRLRLQAMATGASA